MIHDGRFKLVYFASGNRKQLFDLEEDPRELTDLVGSESHAEVLQRLEAKLIEHLYGSDSNWLDNDKLVGLPEPTDTSTPDRNLSLQRGSHWPIPPQSC
jgi:arylsulfatase